MDKISVIVPVYRVEQYIDKCVESIVNQTYTNLEIILVDDGSPDNCPQMCDEWAKKDSRIKVIHKTNGGVSSARNAGLEVATGEYISFIDPDDVIHPQYYQILSESIGNCDCAVCKYKEFDSNIEFYVNNDIKFDVLNTIDALKYGLNKHPEIFYVVWNKIFKTDIVKDFRFDETMKNGEDSLFAFDVLNQCYSICVVQDALYGYFIRSDGAAKSIDVNGQYCIMKLSQHIYEKLISYGDSELNKKATFERTYTFYTSYVFMKRHGEIKVAKELKKEVLKNLRHILFHKEMSLKNKALTLYALIME